jgi:outer membrane protein
MKNLIKSVFVILLITISLSSFSQNAPKFGHLDFGELYSLMPEKDSIQNVFEDYQQLIRDQYLAMQNELENKYLDYQANMSTMSDIIKQTKEKEIQDLQSRMEAFQATAQQDLVNKENELAGPIIEKARNAVKEVAKENGYTYIFNSSEGLLLYSEPGDNILQLVKTKLGIQ